MLAKNTNQKEVCNINYCHGVVSNWCDREKGHQGPCSGNNKSHVVPIRRSRKTSSPAIQRNLLVRAMAWLEIANEQHPRQNLRRLCLEISEAIGVETCITRDAVLEISK